MTREEIQAALTDETALTAVLFGEARGESLMGQLGVACVIRNRVAFSKGARTIKQVILAPFQFSCFNILDQSLNTVLTYVVAEALATDTVASLRPDDQRMVRRLAWVAKGILGGQAPDVTKAARFYMTSDLFNSDHRPSWTESMIVTTVIDRHTFLRQKEAHES